MHTLKYLWFSMLQWLHAMHMVLEQLLRRPGLLNSQSVLNNLCQCHLYLLFCTYDDDKEI